MAITPDEWLNSVINPITGRPMYFNREGEPITMMQHAELGFIVTSDGKVEPNTDYRQIGYDLIGRVEVSTVWIGMNMSIRVQDQPMIFETMIFTDERSSTEGRYASEADALRGHQLIVDMVRARN